MKHKLKNNDGLLTPAEYWEMKLGIKHITEKSRYKKLCGYRLSKIDKTYLDGAYYITFADWNEYIDSKLSALDTKELFEYSKYINARLENENVFSGLLSNFMMSLMISIIGIIAEMLTQYFNKTYNNPILDLISILLKYGTYIIPLAILIKTVVEGAQDNKAWHLFYKDMYELIISKLQQQYKREPKE